MQQLEYLELEARFEHYVELAGQGEEFVVTRNGSPWMKLVPYGAPVAATADTALDAGSIED
ncbi:type II toxin-antitoxin system Phd/YefM family antitoxin [Pseudomonas tohonis]|uniref:type II toxin-antitoxin system Phd/YefM family antitoxin n=1 Tax=Pseudomonas tohonis TaxID=2725477 RepID=UPI00255C0E8B|nr:hypothetical protein [Pseudomonas tohonis]